MNPFQVIWDPGCDDQLAQIWLQSHDPQAVTAAAARADQLLARDPIGNGQHRSEGLYRLDVPPLVLMYNVDSTRRVVEVNGVGSTA
jgi:hypothetical protein